MNCFSFFFFFINNIKIIKEIRSHYFGSIFFTVSTPFGNVMLIFSVSFSTALEFDDESDDDVDIIDEPELLFTRVLNK